MYLIRVSMPISNNAQSLQTTLDQIRPEEILRQVELVVENSYDAIISETLDGVITSWNGGAVRIFGYTGDEVIGKSVSLLIPPDLQNEVPILMNKIKAGEFVADYDSVRLRKDGSKIDIAFSGSPIKKKDGTVIGVSVVERDITMRKKEEEKIRQIKLIVEDSHDAIIGKTLDGIITSWNRGATIMFGYTPEEVIGKSMVNLFPAELKEELPRLLEKVKKGEVIADYDSVWLRKDTTRADVEFSISPVHDVDKKIIGASIVGRDITERKKSERHIKELNETRSKFIDIISHQLRTPLTAVNWNLEMILKGDFGKLEDMPQKFLTITHSASVEITRRIGLLLTAIDIEEQRVRFENEEISLNSLCAGVSSEMLSKSEQRNIFFEYVHPKTDIPAIYGDGKKIRMAISVFVENALGYTKDDGKITMALTFNNNIARYEVKDTGIGIPESEQHLIFNRFYRASNASVMQTDAFGLGLYVAKYFIEQHHGTIGFESKEGVGSMFWLEIPLKNEMLVGSSS